MQELDILKYLFLSNEQMILFNFLSKPSIAITQNQNENILHKETEETDLKGYELKENQIKEIIKSYEELTRSNEGEEDNEINKKIVTLFNNEIDYLMN